jgi:hypothetical protein
MGRASEMKNKANFEQILEMKMPFNGLNGRKIEAFWRLGRVEMRAIPFGGLKPFQDFFLPRRKLSPSVEMRAIPFGGLKRRAREPCWIFGSPHTSSDNEENPLRGIETQLDRSVGLSISSWK